MSVSSRCNRRDSYTGEHDQPTDQLQDSRYLALYEPRRHDPDDRDE